MSATHYFEQFTANVQDLLGEHPNHDLLAHLVDEVKGDGQGTWIDGISAEDSDDADVALLSAKSTRGDFHELAAGSQTWANYLLTKTPHMATAKERTYSAPFLNEWGHYFDADEEWQNLVDPKGKEVNVGVRKIFKNRDLRFITGAVASTVQRKTDANDTLHSVSLPAAQSIDDLTYADLDINNLTPLIAEKFEDVWYAKGMPIFCVISARMKRSIIQLNRKVIHSTDFVSSYADFSQGKLPDIDGITFIVMPTAFLSSFVGAGALDTYFAFCPSAINRVNYKGFVTKSGISPDHRFDTAVYMREVIDFKRIDDQGVVVGDIIPAT